ncbi:chaperonin-containing T-complex subunit [Martiniozyma asiatica (nom. inval.)]|nr:chaperonin-containing T-complex subunit [Martiniozyma asiatica]
MAVQPSNATFKNREKPQEVRKANILAARAVADAIRTSLGPKGMDKMIKTKSGDVIISNDGHTILRHMAVLHPAAKMLVDVSGAQDVEAGDGTTSVVVLTGALLGAADNLLNKGIHPTIISESFQRAAKRSCEVMLEMSHPVSLDDRDALIKAANTSLSSKIVSQFSNLLGPLSVDAVLKVCPPGANNVDLNDIRLIKKLGGTIDDTKMIDGIVLTQTAVKNANGPIRMEKARIGLIQFQLSPPKPDMENNIVVNDYRQMDKILKEERAYILNICKQIKKSKCNVLLIQKSILRDAVNDLSLHFLSKLGIMVVKDIEREEVEFISKSLGCKPIADVESFTESRLASAELIEEVESSGSKIIKITGIKTTQPTVSIVCRGANSQVLDETERSIHDALCVIRCLVKEKALIAGGGAPEIEVSRTLLREAHSLKGAEQLCFTEFANALEVIPTTLAENAGLNPIEIVTELRNKHENGEKEAGISVRRGGTGNVYGENVLQPVLVGVSAIGLASETVKSLLRIDDLAISR